MNADFFGGACRLVVLDEEGLVAAVLVLLQVTPGVRWREF
jgi:hypothetical protein